MRPDNARSRAVLKALGFAQEGLSRRYLFIDGAWIDGLLPPHRWDGQADPALPPLRLVGAGDRLQRTTGRRLMSNSFAFGGNNAAVVLRHAAEPAGSADAAAQEALWGALPASHVEDTPDTPTIETLVAAANADHPRADGREWTAADTLKTPDATQACAGLPWRWSTMETI